MNVNAVLAPVPTPFDERGDVDERRFRAALALWLVAPLSGFVVLGSNGEAAFLDEEESDRVVAVAREEVPADRTFIVGAGRESTRATLRAARRAASLGADAVLVRTPGFFKTQMTADAFLRHYTAVADDSPVPVLLYNYTAVTGVSLPVEVVAKLAAHPNIVGMKESNVDVLRVCELAGAVPADFKVFTGSASTFHEALRAGAVGGILALAAVLPEACTQVFRLTRSGQHDAARALQQTLVTPAKLVGSIYGVAGLKAALKLVGCDVGFPRLPLLPLNATALSELSEALLPFATEVPAVRGDHV